MICRNHVDVDEGVVACSRCGTSFCPDCVVTIHGQPYCATCKSEKLLDLQSGTDPDKLPLAHLGRRFAAVWIDQMIFGAAMVAAIILIAVAFHNADAIIGYFMIAAVGGAYLSMVIYEGAMLARRGQTLGKMALKIKVVRPDGTPISSGQAWGRAVLRGVLLHVLSLLNYIPAVVTKEKTCIHDLVANTRVVNVE